MLALLKGDAHARLLLGLDGLAEDDVPAHLASAVDVFLRAYGVALGATLGLLGLLRATLPPRTVGGLAVRSRRVDASTLLLLGLALAVLATNLRQI